MNKKTTALVSMLLWALTGISQNMLLEGRVVDETDQSPLSFVILRPVNSFQVTQSNAEGEYTLNVSQKLSDICLIAQITGYETDTFCFSTASRDPHIIRMKRSSVMKDEVIVTATRVGENSAFASGTLDKEKIREQNNGRDIPFLLNLQPSVVTTSDAGNGIGYTGISIRGSDATRVNVTINGVPLNDAESQGTFWVNLPDLASSVQNIQVQRGAGTSTNGAGAFGGSVNIQTDAPTDKPYGEALLSGGSFNTRRATFKAGTGIMSNGWSFDARLSSIQSDGYIDRASSDLKSWYTSAGWYGKKAALKAVVFSGKEKTYQAWYGVPEDSLQTNRTFNPAGIYFDNNGNLKYYDNETDNYQQDHYQLHFMGSNLKKLSYNVSLHATRGRGYYEQYKEDSDLINYGLSDSLTATVFPDLIRRLWLDNWFYGTVFSVRYQTKKTEWVTGGAVNRYYGKHFGEIIWSTYLPSGTSFPYRYYDNDATKYDGTVYSKINHTINDKLAAFLDLQYRYVHYSFLGTTITLNSLRQVADMHFFNPKAGITFMPDNNTTVYASFSTANKEPNRNDFTDNPAETRPKPETLYDFEGGVRFRTAKLMLAANGYYMHYINQLILTGKINDVGAYTRENVASSFRTGIELEAGWKISELFTVGGNATFSRNIINNYTEYIDNHDTYTQETKTYSSTPIAFSPSIVASGQAAFMSKNKLGASIIVKHVGKQFLDNTGSEDRVLKAYTVADFRVSKNFRYQSKSEIDLSLSVNNIFNLKYSANGYTYGWIANNTREIYNFYYPMAGTNILAMAAFRF
ncbi:MAG: TonB-dependent receptor [Bacteroidia bacterium]